MYNVCNLNGWNLVSRLYWLVAHVNFFQLQYNIQYNTKFVKRHVAVASEPSVLWRCWLGNRKGIRPVKKLSGGVLAWLSIWSEVQTCIWPRWCNCHSLSLASVKSRLVLLFWYRLTWVVPEKGPLNGCVCVLYYAIITAHCCFSWCSVTVI